VDRAQDRRAGQAGVVHPEGDRGELGVEVVDEFGDPGLAAAATPRRLPVRSYAFRISMISSLLFTSWSFRLDASIEISQPDNAAEHRQRHGPKRGELVFARGEIS
jgi:hypothetical protein